jgi:ABC-type amino acid transport system permease subunit
VVPPTSPTILVRVVGPATDEVTLGDVLLNALGLTGAITVSAIALGIVLGGLFILYRRRHPYNHFNGESSDEMSLKLG